MAAASQLDRTLLRCGVVLFFFGLATGLVLPLFVIPRMGLTSHLEGIFNGLLLMVVGLIWPRLRLGRLEKLTAALLVYGAFANWLATLIAAVTGAAALMPLAGGGHQGDAFSAAIVGFLLLTLSVSLLAAFGLIFWGLRSTRG